MKNLQEKIVSMESDCNVLSNYVFLSIEGAIASLQDAVKEIRVNHASSVEIASIARTLEHVSRSQFEYELKKQVIGYLKEGK